MQHKGDFDVAFWGVHLGAPERKVYLEVSNAV